MHVEKFKIFADLVESQSFSKSARLNGITQSAVSQQLRAMERHFDLLIIDRAQKGFQLTREGERLYRASKDIIHEYEKLTSELQEMRKVVSGTIRLATIYSIGLHELPPFIKRFLQDYPAINLRVEYRRSNLVYEDIIHNAVDIGMVAYPRKMRGIQSIPFREDELVLICSPNHPFSSKKSIKIQGMADQRYVAFDRDIPTRKAIDKILRRHKVDLEPVMEFDNVETIKRAVEIDAGVAIVPKVTVSQEVRQGSLIAVTLSGVSASRPLAILHRKGRTLSPAVKRFIDLLKSETSESLADRS